ncbi:hypothetical protein F4780DRAFT_313771 [Xylariomycetidae sp. FL0641]|nr:hypothetical protein F4780DRAFT_313771 [Xylariomycetidae sp. FL0641]
MKPLHTDVPDKCQGQGQASAGPDNKDIAVQLVISFGLGLTAFLCFCILRPRWKSLYAARRRHSDPRVALPPLPDSFFGWIPHLYRVTEDQILASAGLDAFVFLSFFKMSMRLFATMLFFAATVLWPIHKTFDQEWIPTSNSSVFIGSAQHYPLQLSAGPVLTFKKKDDEGPEDKTWTYLGAYLVFTWFFSFLTLYFMNSETLKVIEVRQDYLGTQSTVTDRTFRLTGIPRDLRTEAKIKVFVENLEIGQVKSVTLCRDWKYIDDLIAQRRDTLRMLEEAWHAFISQKKAARVASAQQNGNADEDDDDDRSFEEGDDEIHTHARTQLLAGNNLRSLVRGKERPKVKLRFGFLKARSKKTDAIDYYEERLRRFDEKIKAARKKEYTPTDTAFVTMDSIASCQMAIQATVDPRPGRLLSKPAPSPSDVIWRNTYKPLYRRKFQAWSITVFITILSIIWLIPVASLAQLLSICNIQRVAPGIADFLQHHTTIQALVRTGLPTLVVSLLNLTVPYVYDYLSNTQGSISQGEVELSTISKNFFFVFFNIFVVYAIAGSAALSDVWLIITHSLRDTNEIAKKVAQSIQSLSNFYLNFIMLQCFGLLPFKLLQFGSVILYPIYRMGAKTPRDFAELVRPDLFNYGFYLPTSLLVFILCLVYSIMPRSQLILLLGLCYFALGYFVFKYQLLYSMDQSQHATGGAWPMICGRIILGLISFHLVMIAVLVLRKAWTAAGLVVPLLVITLWYNQYFRHKYVPLMRFIALRSIKRGADPGNESNPEQDLRRSGRGLLMRLTRRLSTIDEDRERGLKFVNPSLVVRLEQPWIYKDPPPPMSPDLNSVNGGMAHSSTSSSSSSNGSRPGRPSRRVSNAIGSGLARVFSFGDSHVWRDNGGNNV